MYNWLVMLGILMVGGLICAIPTVADFPATQGGTSTTSGSDFPTTHGGITTGFMDFEYWNPYAGWDMVTTTGFDTWPILDESWAEILPPPSSSADNKPSEGTGTNNGNAVLPPSSSSVDHWVKFSYFSAGTSPGQPAILSGYVGGENNNAEVTIAGRKESTGAFHKIVTIKPQQNGVFVWAIPDDLAIVQFYEAAATVGGTLAKSEIVSTSVVPVSQDPSSAYDAGTSAPSSSTPVVAVSAPVASITTAPAATSSSLPGITYLTLSADILRPAVGQEVTLSGSLTSNGKGISGATITIEVPDYGTDFLPLISTTTDSSGRFSATINTWEGGVVPVQAVFSGDDKYQAATSSTLTFTAGTASAGSGFQ